MDYNKERIIELYSEESTITDVAKAYAKEKGVDYTDSIRRTVSNIINKQGDGNVFGNESETSTNQYQNDKEKPTTKIFTAIDPETGKMMSIEQYCEHYGLDFDKVRSYKLVSHTGIPYFNIAFYETVIEPTVTEEELKGLISEGLEKNVAKEVAPKGDNIGVVKIADLHLGSYVDGLIRTKSFSIDLLAQKLRNAAREINRRSYDTVYVHILGDLIESFSGMNHKNSWKGLEKSMVGAEAVKLTCKILHKDFLNLIENLGEIKLVAGNHDRTSSDNKEDVKGDAANLIGWGLELMGYKIEFNSLVITHTIGGICHILTHGHHPISKKSTKQLCWDYGEQGKFNLICEGHLHSIIEKLSISQKESFSVIKDDAVDHRRMNCPSFFTGNFYSESLGYTSQSGFVIVEDNGQGVPNVFYYAV